MAAIFLNRYNVLSFLYFLHLFSFSFDFLPWGHFGNEGDTVWENEDVILSVSVPKSS